MVLVRICIKSGAGGEFRRGPDNTMTKSKKIALGVMLLVIGAVVAVYLSAGATRNSRAERGARAKHPGLAIGVAAPLTGYLAGYGAQVAGGAKAAVDELNAAGGVLGGEVVLTVLDTRSDADTEAEVIEALASKYGSHVIIEYGDEFSTAEGAAVAEANKVPMIYLADGQLKTCNPKDPKAARLFVWGGGLTPQMAIEPLLIYLSDKFSKPERQFTFSYIGASLAPVQTLNSFARATAESLGFKTIDELYYDTRIEDYYTVLRDLLAQDPDVVWISNPGASGQLFMTQATKLQLSRDMQFAGFGMFDQELMKNLAAVSQGAYGVSSYSAEDLSPENKRFLELFKRSNPEAPAKLGASAANAYSMVAIAAESYKRAGKFDRSLFSSALRSAFADSGFPSPAGEIKVRTDSGVFSRQLYITQVVGDGMKAIEKIGVAEHVGLEGCGVEE